MRIWWSVFACIGIVGSAQADEIGQRTKKLFGGAVRRFAAPVIAEETAPREYSSQSLVRQQPYMTVTRDGWKLVAQRYLIPGRTDPAKLPVILCHGFSYNHRFFDLTPDVSLANYLAQSGFDVWVVDLRGSGLSQKWALTAHGGADALTGRLTDKLLGNRIPRDGFVSLDIKYANWTVDDHIDHDLPALLALVKQQSGSDRVAWLGHSLGGNVMLGYLAKYGQDASVARLATVGSQVTMPKGQLMVEYLIEMLERRQMQMAGRGREQWSDALATANSLFFNDANVDPIVKRTLSMEGFDMPALGLIRQYQDLGQTQRLRSADRKFDYSSAITRIECPCLFVVGAADQIATVGDQEYLRINVSSADKQVVVLGRRTGYSTDFGHNDSVVGRTSAREVFPVLARWLAGNSDAPPAATSAELPANAPR